MSHANVTIHASQFPEAVRQDLLESLRTRRVNHKFHYDSIKQTQKWLTLHQAYAPSRKDDDCAMAYDQAFAKVATLAKTKILYLVGLGCGGGQKDTRLLRRLKKRERELYYTPCDVSAAMTLVARKAATGVVRSFDCFPLVCDLTKVRDLDRALPLPRMIGRRYIVTFFGMIPNFEPDEVLPRIAKLTRRGDWFLFSANLAPGRDYAAGVRQVLPQYDNALTRDWLMTFLLDLGVEQADGKLRFKVENGAQGLKRIVARFEFARSCRVAVEADTFHFRRGESIRLFYSYRYTAERARALLRKFRFNTLNEWLIPSGEEGVFLCQRQ